jgi:hypothetical protein
VTRSVALRTRDVVRCRSTDNLEVLSHGRPFFGLLHERFQAVDQLPSRLRVAARRNARRVRAMGVRGLAFARCPVPGAPYGRTPVKCAAPYASGS